MGLYLGGLIFGGGGLIFGMRCVLVHVVGLYKGGAYIRGGGLYPEVYGKEIITYKFLDNLLLS